ncbi:MAG: hypothetical protein D6791_17620, partial [Chloroflexi bacterium]
MRPMNSRRLAPALLTAGLLICLAALTTGAQPALQGEGRPVAASRPPENLGPAAQQALQTLLARGATIAWHERTGVPDFITA